MPSLTIIIPSYRRADLLKRCLTAVVANKPSWAEVLVIDDASEGGYISACARVFPEVRVHRLGRRSGFCRAINTGLALASTEFIELLNDDTLVTPGWCEAALAHFQNEDVVAVAPLVLQLSSISLSPRIDSAGDGYDVGGFAFKRGHGQWANLPEYQQPQEVWGVSGAAGFFRREAVLKVGGLPDDFGAYFEDVDLSHRLRQAGGRAWYEPASVVWHEVSASYGRRPSRRTLEQQSCNEERLFWRHTPKPRLWSALPRHAGVLVLKAVRRLQEGTLAPWLSGRLKAWRLEWSRGRGPVDQPTDVC